MSAGDLQSSFVIALGAIGLLWVAVVLTVIGRRLLHDGLHALVRRMRASGSPRHLPRFLAEHVATDPATPTEVARLFAEHVARGGRKRLLRRASGHTTDAGKWRRLDALRILALAAAPEAIPLLEQALADEDEQVVAGAVTISGGIGTTEGARLLVGALEAGRVERSQVAAQLEALPIDIHDLLLPLARANDPAVRRWATTLLARYRHKPQIPLELAALSGDPDPNVRAAALQALTGVDEPAAIATALELLNDDVWYVRAHAARTLASFDRTEFGPLVAELLADERWWVRTAAKEALEDMGEEATPAVVSTLVHNDRFARNSAAEVLQNSGELDRLIEKAAAEPHDLAALSLVRRAFEAGGDGMARASIARLEGKLDPDGRARMRRLTQRLAS